MRTFLELASSECEVLIDITARVREAVAATGVQDGLCAVYALVGALRCRASTARGSRRHGATAAIMIQENWTRT